MNAYDYTILILYSLIIIGVGIFVTNKRSIRRNPENYFVANRSLPWWAIGASLIAANISSEQIIGMNTGSFSFGIAVASYEWLGAFALVVIAKFFLPHFFQKSQDKSSANQKENIITLPQFLGNKQGKIVRVTVAVMLLILYIGVNITAILFLGAKFLSGILDTNIVACLLFLVFLSSIYTVFGGFNSIAWTDTIHMFMIIGGGLVITICALHDLDPKAGGDIFKNLTSLYHEAGDKFHLIIERRKLFSTDSTDAYKYFPGIFVLFGGMWVAHFFYWGCNQYIIQKALAAENLTEARNGMLFAGVLKLLLPALVILPGIIASYRNADPKPLDAYTKLFGLVNPGLKGLASVAFISAVVSSLSAMVNSVATIFTKDIYEVCAHQHVPDNKQIKIARLTSMIAFGIVILIALLYGTKFSFEHIQMATGFVSPIILVMFLYRIMWKRSNTKSATLILFISIPATIIFSVEFSDIPFLNRMGLMFLLLVAVSIIVSLFFKHHPFIVPENGTKTLYKSSDGFNITAFLILLILIFLYIFLW